MNKNLGLILKVVAFAMGIALVVMALTGSIASNTGFAMAGIGLLALALDSLMGRK